MAVPGLLPATIGDAMSTAASAASSQCRALLGALPEAILICDTEGTVEFLNTAAERLTRHTSDSAVGRRLDEIIPLRRAGTGAPIKSPVLECLRRGHSVGPFMASLSSGPDHSVRIVEVSAAPISQLGEPVSGVIVVARDVTRERELARRMSHRATHDALTGLVNRAEFEHRLARAVESAAQNGAQHVLGFLDLDGFKRVNDSCGHLAGDRLLQELSAVLRRRIRGRDTVARLGGDEFGILLEHCTLDEGAHIVEQVRREISEHSFACEGHDHRVGASIGIVSLDDGHAAPAEVIRAADMACYGAKRRGGNRVSVAALNGNGMRHATAASE